MKRSYFEVAILALVLAGCASARPPASNADPQAASSQKPKAKPPEPSTQSEESAEGLRYHRDVSRVLRDLRDSLEGATPRRVMELMDESLADLPRFEDQITALMRQTLERRFFFRESSWEVKGDKASLIVDAEVILTARNRARTQQRRRERVQIDFLKGGKGWKIYEISPRGFFAP